MKLLKRKNEINQFLFFILTGGLSAIINIVSRIIFSIFLDFNISILLAYFIGMITAYFLAKNFVFVNSNKSNKKSFPAFALINLIAVIQTFYISNTLRIWLMKFFIDLFLLEFISHLCGVVFPIFTSYLGHKYISFGKSKK